MILLNDRAIIEVSGDDRADFLQNLITNDIKLCNHNNIIYSALLNPVGRFLFDFFIFNNDQKFYIDCHINEIDNLISKLNLYKLKSKVVIVKNSNILVIANHKNLGYQDPRSAEIGFRFYTENNENNQEFTESLIDYHHKRISLKIPDGYYDLTKDKSFFLEFNFDNLQAISYNKGCYIGQEITARTHYKGQIRKKLYKFIINDYNSSTKLFINKKINENILFANNKYKLVNIKNSELIYKEINIGIFLSAIYDEFNENLFGLCLIKDDFFEINKKITLNIFDNEIEINIF